MFLFKFFLKRPLIAIIASLILALAGIISVFQLTRSTLPEVDISILSLETVYEGATPKEVELNVTNKIEEQLISIEGIDRTRSWSLENVSYITIWIDLDHPNPESVKNQISNALEKIPDLPKEVRKTKIDYMKTSNIPVIQIGVAGGTEDMRRKAATALQEKFRNVKGVSSVVKEGYRKKEINVELDLEKLREKKISLIEIGQALRKRNIKVSSGNFEKDGKTKKIITDSEFQTIQDIKNLAIRANFTGKKTLLQDVAKVKEGYEKHKVLIRSNGLEGIGITVRALGSSDIINVSKKIQHILKKSKKGFHPDLQVNIINETSRYTESMLKITKSNGLIGLILVFTTMLLFLTRKVAIWTTIGLPVSLFGAMAFFRPLGININLMTLITMILVLGLLVDDALVIAENITRHREMGKNRMEAALDGVKEMFWPVTTTVITTILSFTPMFFLSGVLGKTVQVIPIVIIITLLISLFECTCLLPAHIVAGKKGMDVHVKEPDWWIFFKNLYGKIILYLLKKRFLTLTVFLSLLIGSFVLFELKMNFILFPSNDANLIQVIAGTQEGTSITKTMEKIQLIEKKLKEITGVDLNQSYSLAGHHNTNPYRGTASTGGQENAGMVVLNLKHSSKRKQTSEEILKEINNILPKMEKKYHFKYLHAFIQNAAPGVGRPIHISIISKNEQLRKKLSDDIYNFLEKLKGIKNLSKDFEEGKPQVRVIPNFDKIYRYGVSPETIASTLGIVFGGLKATKIHKDNENIDIKLSVNKQKYKNVQEILKVIQVPNSRGNLLDLHSFIKTKKNVDVNMFVHFKGTPAITITADTQKGILTPIQANKLFHQKFQKIIDETPEVSIEIGGEEKATQKSINDFKLALPFAILCVYFVLVILFDSLLQPFIIITAIPFGAAGVVYTFFFVGKDLNFFAVIGLLGLIGIVVNDSLIMVHHLNQLSKERPLTLELLVQGSKNRLRAVILTTITTVAGMTPTIFGFGGSEPFLIPLVLAVAGGLIFATIITLILVPTLYSFKLKRSS